MTAVAERALRIMVKRLDRLERIRALALDAFEFIDDKRFCVRRMAVVEHVSRELRLPISNQLCTSVALAVRSLGFEPVKCAQRRLFRKVRPRGLDEATALLRSQELRRKERRV